MMRPRPQAKKGKIGVNKWVLVFIFALLLVSVWLLSPSGSSSLHRDKGDLGLRLGLDLKGGIDMAYQAQFPADETASNKKLDMDATIARIRTRIDAYGVIEPVILKQGSDRIIVQLPGLTNVEDVQKYMLQPGSLEFSQVEMKDSSTVATLGDYLNATNLSNFFDTSDATVEGTNRIFVDANGLPIVFLAKSNEGLKYVDKDGNPVDTGQLDKTALSWMPACGTINDVVTPLTGKYLTKASPETSASSTGVITISVGIGWNKDGADLFGQITKRLRDRGAYGTDQRALGIFLDNARISAPQVYPSDMTGDYGDTASITGNFTQSQAKLLAIQLRSGALPVSLNLIYGPVVVSATLGKDFIHRSVVAGVIGLAVVALFMILYYRLLGVVATLALLIYTALVLAVYKAVGVTLTLAGLAGFIISLGMAVDANVLIFERMKEELRSGRTVKAAVDAGFSRAWPAIRDSNVTTFIICGILYWFGSSVVASTTVKGFAATLFFGVALSMFSAITVTRSFLFFFIGTGAEKKLSRFGVEAKDA
jgi:preprotein translocase subunit SecD